jgi:hypothetical protein
VGLYTPRKKGSEPDTPEWRAFLKRVKEMGKGLSQDRSKENAPDESTQE